MCVPVSIWYGHQQQPGELINLSPGGIYFTSVISAEHGRAVTVSLRIVPDVLCAGFGTIVRADSGGFAIKWTSINDALRELTADIASMPHATRTELVTEMLDPVIQVSDQRE